MNFHTAITSGFDVLLRSVGEQVRYERGEDWVSILAVAGQSTFDVVDNNNVVIQTTSADYLIRECDLELGSAMVLPQRGDKIIATKCNKHYVFEVTRPDGNEQVYRYSDLARNILRVHTVLRGVENL